VAENSYVPVPTPKKKREIDDFLTGYWANDVWNVDDPFFEELKPETWNRAKYLNFSMFQEIIKKEIKFFFAKQLSERKISLHSAFTYSTALKHFNKFLHTFYPKIKSMTELEPERSFLQWRTYLINDQSFRVKKDGRLGSSQYEIIFNQLLIFIHNYYDTREEFEKDVWDVRNIPGARYTQNTSDYLLSFIDTPAPFRHIAKRYIKMRISKLSLRTCVEDIMSLRLFLKFIHKIYPHWEDLNDLSRQDMENYLSWYKSYTKGWVNSHYEYLIKLKIFFDYIQRAEYPEAPQKPAVLLLFKEDFPKKPIKADEDIKFVSENVLVQLEENIENIKPQEYIPVVIILRASGWRISDVLALRYDNCLEKTTSGWWLKGDIQKTDVLNHRVPITDEIAAVVKAQAELMEEKSNKDNNPDKLLFARLNGKRKGKPPLRRDTQEALNRLAKDCNIVDDQGNIFHFKTHAFRHTKGVELINSGMNLLHVQKWMAHASPEMTNRYARILDTTMRKSWEEAVKNGVFRIDTDGNPRKVDISELENEDEIEWEYIRYNLDAVRMPLGYCLKPSKVECKHQLNPCLNCRNLCTTPDFIPQYELEIQEVKHVIERGRAQGRTLWVEKNQALLERYETILATLKDGKTHHMAGKKGREYVGEERQNVPQT